MSDDQLSTVQQLWRDRRPEFEAYLDGQAECVCQNEVLTKPKFGLSATQYTFRPKPKPPSPPTLRPLTRDEWIERMRDDWFLRRKDGNAIHRIYTVNDGAVSLAGIGTYKFETLFEQYEMSADLKTWYLCGVLSSEVAK